MNEADELTGTLALVNPGLENDPVGKQGKAGIILFAHLGRDDIYLTFGKGEQALYSSDALLVFKKPDEIYKELIGNTRDIPVPEMKDLYRVGMLLDSGQSKDAKEAMKIAENNPAIHNRAMISLQEQLGPDLELGPSQNQEASQNRGR
jgi:hypothetical protein